MPKEIIEEPYIDPNPEIITWKKGDGVLEKSITHKDPKVKTESFNIEHVQGKIDKINGAIAAWESKRAPYQAIIDKYNEL